MGLKEGGAWNSPNTSMAETKWFDAIYQSLNEIIQKSFQGIFDATSALIHNTMSYTVILVTIMVWLIMRLKNGYPTKDEMFNAGKWLMLVLFVYAVFYSYASYTGFISTFMLPANWIKSIITEAMGFKGQNLIDIINQAVDTVSNMAKEVWKRVEHHGIDDYMPDEFGVIVYTFRMFFFWIYIVILYIALFGGLLIITGSNFIATFLLAAAPILIPFIIFKALRAYFFSWLKLFISYSLYAPVAFIIMSIILKPIDDYKKLGEQSNYAEKIFLSPFIIPITSILITVLGIYFMTKIPNWVSQIMGVQGLDAGGTGQGLALAKKAGNAGASGAMGGIMKGGQGMIGGAKLGGKLGSVAGPIGTVLGGVTGALGGSILGSGAGAIGGVAKHIPGGSTAGALGGATMSGLGKVVKAGIDKVAKAG